MIRVPRVQLPDYCPCVMESRRVHRVALTFAVTLGVIFTLAFPERMEAALLVNLAAAYYWIWEL